MNISHQRKQLFTISASIALLTMTSSCRLKTSGSELAEALTPVQKAREALGMNLYVDLPIQTGDETKSLSLINAFSSALVYSSVSGKYINEAGSKSIRNPTTPDGSVKQMLRYMSTYDLHMTSSLKRLQAAKQLSNATVIIAPNATTDQINKADLNKVEDGGFLSMPLNYFSSLVSLFSDFSIFTIPKNAITYQSNSSSDSAHGIFSKKGLPQLVRASFIKRYNSLVRNWEAAKDPAIKLFYLTKIYSPIVMQSQISVHSDGSSSLYTEAYFMAPGIATVKGDVSQWKIDAINQELATDKVLRTPIVEFNKISYTGASKAGRQNYSLMKISTRKTITSGGWAMNDNSNQIKVRISVGQLAKNPNFSDLIDIDTQADEYGMNLSGRLKIQNLPYTGPGAKGIDKAISKINNDLKIFDLSLHFLDAEIAMSRKGTSTPREAFQMDHPFRMTLATKGMQRFIVKISWDNLKLHNAGPVAAAFAKVVKDASITINAPSGDVSVAQSCIEDVCNFQLNVLEGDNGSGIRKIIEFLKGKIKAEVVARGNNATLGVINDLDQQISTFVTGSLHMLALERQKAYRRFHNSGAFARFVQ